MKVLHFATSISGGAGQAAVRLHSALRARGIDSTLAIKKSQVKFAQNLNGISSYSQQNKFLSSTNTLFQRKLLQINDDLVTPISISTIKIDSHIKKNFDIYHVHAFYNQFSFGLIRKLSEVGKPVFITLHDQRLLTGGCHYSRGCLGFSGNCENCPQVKSIFQPLVTLSKINSYSNLRKIENLHLISPSKWLGEIAKFSGLTAAQNLSIIRNPIPQHFFEKRFKNESSAGMLRIVFVSENLNNPYKGLNFLISSLSRVHRNFLLTVVGAGEIEHNEIAGRISFVGSLTEKELAEVFLNNDLLIVPSSQDNMPSVLGEALASGLEIIGSRVGGIEEILNSFEMNTFEPHRSDELTSLIENWSQKERRIQIREKAKDEFSNEIVADKISLLYKESLN